MGATRTGTSTTTSAGNYFIVGRSGATLASAATITVTDGFHEVTGAEEISTINGGTAGMGLLLYKPVGATWTIGSGGNIHAAVTPTEDRVILLATPDGTTWYAGADNQVQTLQSANTDITVALVGDTYTITFNPANVSLTEFAGTLAIGSGGTGQTTQAAAFDALAPTGGKGQIIAHNGSDNVGVAAGTNGYVLTADSTTASGVAWDDSLNIASGVFSGNVQVGDGTAAAPAIEVGSTDKGLYEIGANELGISTAGVGRLSIDSSRIAPVTSLGLKIGDSDQVFSEGWIKRDYGYASKSLSTTLGGATQNFLTAVIASPDIVCGFQISTLIVCKSGTLYSAYDSAGELETWNVIICRDQSNTYVTTLSASGMSASSTGTGSGTATGTLTATAGSNIVTFGMTTAGTVATPVEVTLYYKITVIYGSPTFAEV